VTGGAVLNTNNGDGSFAVNGLADGGGFLYTGDPDTNTLRKVDYNGNLISSISASGFATSCCNEDFAFDGTTFYHVHYDGSGGQIDRIDPATGNSLATYAAPCGLDSAPVGITFVGSQLWISCWESSQVGTWVPGPNGASTFTPKFTVATLAGGLAYDAANGILWVGRLGGWVEPFDLNGTLLGPGFQPFGSDVANTIDGLEFISQPATQVDFESPSLGGADRQQISPYTAGGVTFTAEPEGGFSPVVGLVKNSSSSTSACVPPESANQLLGTAPASGGSIGLSGFAIRGTFAGGLSGPVTVSVDIQALNGLTARLRLFDAADTLLTTATAVTPATGVCSGAPGGDRGRVTLTAALASGTAAYAVVDTTNSGFVFVIDNFKIQ
jgi:hypothetical protein